MAPQAASDGTCRRWLSQVTNGAAGCLRSNHLQEMSVGLASQEAPVEHPKYVGQPINGTAG